MDREDDGLSRQRERERDAVAAPLAELVAQLDLDTAARRERLDRLDAAQVRAGEDALDRERLERRNERERLLATPLVERPQPVVAEPG